MGRFARCPKRSRPSLCQEVFPISIINARIRKLPGLDLDSPVLYTYAQRITGPISPRRHHPQAPAQRLCCTPPPARGPARRFSSNVTRTRSSPPSPRPRLPRLVKLQLVKLLMLSLSSALRPSNATTNQRAVLARRLSDGPDRQNMLHKFVCLPSPVAGSRALPGSTFTFLIDDFQQTWLRSSTVDVKFSSNER